MAGLAGRSIAKLHSSPKGVTGTGRLLLEQEAVSGGSVKTDFRASHVLKGKTPRKHACRPVPSPRCSCSEQAENSRQLNKTTGSTSWPASPQPQLSSLLLWPWLSQQKRPALDLDQLCGRGKGCHRRLTPQALSVHSLRR